MPDIDKLDIGALLNLAPEEAIKSLKSKGFAITWDWKAAAKASKEQAFTVAKAMKMDVLQDIRGMLDRSLADGLSFRGFQKELEPMLQARGWWGKQVVDGKVVQLGSLHRLKTIYDTNMQSALNAGRAQAQLDNQDNRPFLEYIAIQDSATRPTHMALHGTIKPIDSAFWKTYYPPNGYRCRCRTRDLTFKQMKKRGGITKEIPKIKDAIPQMKSRGISTKEIVKRKDLDSIVKPDEGFNSNPLKAWEPKKTDYDTDIWNAGNNYST